MQCPRHFSGIKSLYYCFAPSLTSFLCHHQQCIMFYNFLVFGLSCFIAVGLGKTYCFGAVLICTQVQILDFHSVKMILPTPWLIPREQGNFWNHAQLSPYIDPVDFRDVKLHASSLLSSQTDNAVYFSSAVSFIMAPICFVFRRYFFWGGVLYFKLWTMPSSGT